jgi:hypothetical protein
LACGVDVAAGTGEVGKGDISGGKLVQTPIHDDRKGEDGRNELKWAGNDVVALVIIFSLPGTISAFRNETSHFFSTLEKCPSTPGL